MWDEDVIVTRSTKRIYTLFHKQQFYKKRQAEIDKKNQANVKQHPEAELLVFENYSHLHPRYHPKIIGHFLKNKQKNKWVCTHRLYD